MASKSTAPEGLHSRGKALWSALGQTIDTPAGQLALEACRSADRLDELDSIIAGRGVLNLLAFRLHLDIEDPERINVTVGFQAVLAEARQQQTTFARMLDQLGMKSAASASPIPTPSAANALDELEQRRTKSS